MDRQLGRYSRRKPLGEMEPDERVRLLRVLYVLVAVAALAHGGLTLVWRWQFLRWITSAADGAQQQWSPVASGLASGALGLAATAVVVAAWTVRARYVVTTAALLVPVGAVSSSGPWAPEVPGVWGYTPGASGLDLSPDPFVLAAAIDCITLVGALVLFVLVPRARRRSPTSPDDVMRPGGAGDRTA